MFARWCRGQTTVISLCLPPADLSWEYTCQLEANVVLQKPVKPNRESLTLPTSNGGVDTPSNGDVDTPTQWQPAPLASQEDLLSIRRSTPSTSSNRGWVSLPMILSDATSGCNKLKITFYSFTQLQSLSRN